MKKVSASRKLLPDFEFLLKEAKAGSEPAQLEILQCLRKLGFKLAYQSGCIDRLGEEDAVQLARLGVLRAICDWHEGDDIHRFVAFPANKMRTELRTAMRRQVTADFMESGSSKAGHAGAGGQGVPRVPAFGAGQAAALAGAASVFPCCRHVSGW